MISRVLNPRRVPACAVILVLLGTGSCARIMVKSYTNPLDPYEGRLVKGGWYAPAERERVARYNRAIIESDYADERPYRAGGARPDLVVALSGGGMRSAAYSIGVLSALAHERPEDFQRVDIISSVSGGSYALSWYYLQQYYLQQHGCVGRQCVAGEQCGAGSQCAACPQEVLDTHGEFQQRLARHGGLTSKKRIILTALPPDLALMPVNVFANGLFGWHKNTELSHAFYENRLEQTFHRLPEEACGGFTNGYQVIPYVGGLRGVSDTVSNWPTLGVKDDDVTVSQLGAFAHSQSLPLFVINATWTIDDDTNHQAARLSNSVFEFTADHMGSSGLGYYPWAQVREPVTVSEAVSISGAAVDTAIVAGPSQKTLFSLLNVSGGYYIDNPDPAITETNRLWHMALPFPFYFANRYARDKDGIRVYLSDGGHSDNIGVFSAVRRLPKRLIIVDAENDYDAEADVDRFDAYYVLKEALRSEMGAEMCVADVEIRPGVGPYNTPRSVMEGTIGPFPVLDGEGGVKLEWVAVKYVKLSIDRDGIANYPPSVQTYYGKTKESSCGGLLDECPFPQESTADQSYDAEQFTAYRDLGYWTVQNQFGAWLLADGNACSREPR